MWRADLAKVEEVFDTQEKVSDIIGATTGVSQKSAMFYQTQKGVKDRWVTWVFSAGAFGS